jgi:archaellum component FlaC
MNHELSMPWSLAGFRANLRARRPGRFIDQYLLPLFYRSTTGILNEEQHREFSSEEAFWADDEAVMLGEVRLKNFRLTDWFPRAPGVFWSDDAQFARRTVMAGPSHEDPYLGRYFSPKSKMDLIEDGGIGSVRLRPRKIDEKDCWLATALTGHECHSGVPLAIPNKVLNKASVEWGEQAVIEGRVRFLQDAGLDDTAASVHHARPLIVFVDKIKGVKAKEKLDPIIISPVALFESADSNGSRFERAQYTFVQCPAGEDAQLDGAAEWIEKYAEKHSGRVITNFDEQRPLMADAPLSYQKLVARTYDRTVIEHFSGTIRADRVDRVLNEIYQYGDTRVENNINVGGSAIINIDSTLNNVSQAIGAAPGLTNTQKSDLEKLVASLRSELDTIKATHADEAKAITDALEKAVSNAAKPLAERKKSILDFSVKGLKEAAELVADVAPKVLSTATLIGKFITGLQ